MSAQTRTQPGQVVEYSANNQVYEKLDRGWVYRELYLRLHGEVNISTAGSAGSAPMSPEAIIKRLRLRKNTTQDVYSMDFHALVEFSRIFFPTTTQVGYKGVDVTATGKQEFEVFVVLPMWMPQVAKPIEWALNALQLTDLRIEVQWGDVDDVVGDADATFSREPQLEVSKYVHTGGAIPQHRGWRLTNMVSSKIGSASDNFRMELTPGEMYRGFLIRTLSGSTPGPATDVLESLALKTGSETFFEVGEKELRYLAPIRKDHGQLTGGYYFFDMLGDGYGTEAIDTRGWQDVHLKAEVLAPTNAQIDVYPIEMLPNRGKDD